MVLEKKNLTLQVYQGIKNCMINLDYPPGSFLKEREVAEKFGVSRTPVREAFQRLHHEGWLLIGEGKKIQVRPVVTNTHKMGLNLHPDSRTWIHS